MLDVRERRVRDPSPRLTGRGHVSLTPTEAMRERIDERDHVGAVAALRRFWRLLHRGRRAAASPGISYKRCSGTSSAADIKVWWARFIEMAGWSAR
jgi:hypothetical protein